MSPSFLSAGRIALLVTEDDLHIYASRGGRCRLAGIVPWEAEAFVADVSRILRKDLGSKPVLILTDTVDQHYRKEKLAVAAIGVMDRAAVIQRKLGLAFPEYPYRAYLHLKEKQRKKSKEQKTDIYLFAAVPPSEALLKVVEAVRKSWAAVIGFGLLPVESAGLLNGLSKKLQAKKSDRPKWAVLIGQHRSGGLRQIVTKNGDLALTRLTPLKSGFQDPGAWAEEVRQQYDATISYLARFGYVPEDGIHVIAVTGAQTGDALRGAIGDAALYSSLTSVEAARIMNLPSLDRDDIHYADALHASWALNKRRFDLPLRMPALDALAKIRRGASFAMIALCLTGAFFAYDLAMRTAAFAQMQNGAQVAEDRLSQTNLLHEKLVEKQKAAGFDVSLAQSALEVSDQLNKNRVSPVDLFQKIGLALEPGMHADALDFENLKDAPASAQEGLAQNVNAALGVLSGETPFEADFTVVLQMRYPPDADPQAGNKEVTDLADRLKAGFPSFNTKVTKLLKDYAYKQEVTVETGDKTQEKTGGQDYLSEITIKGIFQK